jgi:hypothetical protein
MLKAAYGRMGSVCRHWGTISHKHYDLRETRTGLRKPNPVKGLAISLT